MRNRLLPSALALLAALVVVAWLLLAAVERTGLPTILSGRAAAAVLAVAIAAGLAMSAAGSLELFLRGNSGFTPGMHGLLLTLAVVATVVTVEPLSGHPQLIVFAVGAGGLALALVWIAPLLATQGRFASPGDQLAERYGAGARWPAALGGIAVGLPLAIFGLQAAALTLADATGIGGTLPLLLAASLLFLAVIPGGARSLAAGLCIMVLIAALSVTLQTGIARWMLGPLPLPGTAPPEVLTLIAAERQRWIAVDAGPPVLTQLPDWQTITTGSLASGIWVLALGLVVAVGLPVAAPARARSRGFGLALIWLIGSATLVLALVAVGAFAIEAAGLGLAGASMFNPPRPLLELGRLNLVEVCGAPALDLATVRRSCGATALSEQAIAPDHLQFSARYTWNGLLVALGIPEALALPGRLFLAAAAMATAILGLSLATTALAHDLLFRVFRPRAIASWRIAIFRLLATAIVVYATSMALRPGLGGSAAPVLKASLGVGLALLLPLILLAAIPGSRRFPAWPMALAAAIGCLVSLTANDLRLDDAALTGMLLTGLAAGLAFGLASLAVAGLRERQMPVEPVSSPPPAA